MQLSQSYKIYSKMHKKFWDPIHFPKKPYPEIIFSRKTIGQTYNSPNVHFPERALARNYISLNVHLPEFTFGQNYNGPKTYFSETAHISGNLIIDKIYIAKTSTFP